MNEQICNTISGWFPPPHGYDGVRAAFGNISVSGTALIGPTWWEPTFMTMAKDLPGCTKPLYCNRKIEPMLREALRQCMALGDGYQITTIGCFAPRTKRSNPNSLSLHSWGVAVDLNADDNPPMWIKTPDDLAKKKKTIPDAWIEIFKSIGWTWGGDFSSYFDPMHLQFCSGC